MGTSRRRTPPAPVSTGPPKGARTARRGSQKTHKDLFGFKRIRDFLVNPVLRFAASGAARASTGGELPKAAKIFPTRS